jgi:hypothetical protein
MIEQLMEIVNGYHGKDFFIMGEIPQKKLASSTAFHGVDPRDTVLVLLDSTITGSAENGMSITLKGIYWKNMWATKTRKNSYSWEELQHIYKQIEISSGNLVFEPGVQFYIPANYSNESLLNLIKTLTQFFIETTQYEPVTAPAYNASEPVHHQTLTALPSANSDSNVYYETAIVNSMALCVCHSGISDENCLELAIDFINSDESIINTAQALDKLSLIMDLLEKEANKSTAFFKLRQSKLIAECKPLSSSEREQILIMIEGLQERADDIGREKIAVTTDKIIAAIS